MNRLRALIRSVFGFSRTETNGFLILLPLIAILLFSEPVYQWITANHKENVLASQRRLDSLVANWEFEQKNRGLVASAEKQQELFPFNPNTATEADLLTLGFPGNLAQRILHYRAKGGKFAVKSDLKKIYGMDSVLYATVLPFVKLPETQENVRPLAERKEPEKKPEASPFDLNRADTTQLKSIYGIGPVLSRRIVRYRENLGGFVSFDQLREVRGLDSVVIDRLSQKAFIQPDNPNARISINHADEKTLAAHPYIRAKSARAIVTYRFQHGNFKTIDDLKKIESLKTANLDKLAPYLNFED